MSHRALVAYERPDGGYDLHRSRWGAQALSLARRLTASRPYGGRRCGAPAVSPLPFAHVESVGAVVARIDPVCHEALYVVDRGYAVTAFVVCPFGDGEGPADGPAGALVEALSDADPAVEAARIRGWLAGARSLRELAGREGHDGIDRTLLARALDRWAGDDRTVHRLR